MLDKNAVSFVSLDTTIVDPLATRLSVAHVFCLKIGGAALEATISASDAGERCDGVEISEGALDDARRLVGPATVRVAAELLA